MSAFKTQVIKQLQRELPKLGNRKKAIGAQAYMKDIAPFLGVMTPERRNFVKSLLASLPVPTSDEISETVRALWKIDEREFQYSANDILGKYNMQLDKKFLAEHCEYFISTKSWWDTVDGLGSAVVSPLTMKYPAESLMRKWNKSEDIWLVRASIQHQRGRKYETDVDLLFGLCAPHVAKKEFFIAKAIGWALRDLSRIDNREVIRFLNEHPDLNSVAVREAKKLTR
jgi:3-methyladenine DNA glycosylase AlkD